MESSRFVSVISAAAQLHRYLALVLGWGSILGTSFKT
jgi:hypothetical protein